jgi:hypothetical protein
MPGYIKPPSNQYIYSSSTVDGARIMTAASDYGFRNKLMNANFDIWQRGTSFSSVGYTADRWRLDFGGSGTGATVTQQLFTPGSAPVLGYEAAYFAQVATTSGSDAGSYITFEQRVENVRTLAGKPVTVSFWAKATSGSPKVGLEVIQNSGGSGSGVYGINSTTKTLGNSWARHSFTFNMPALTWTSGQVGSPSNSNIVINFWLSNGSSLTSRSGNPGLQSNTFHFWGFQLEEGLVATSFEERPQQVELAMCQRYYEKNYADTIAPGSNLNPASNGMIEQQAFMLTTASGATPASSRSRSFPYPFKVQKRATPSVRVWDLAGNINKYTAGDSNGSFSSNNNSFDIYGGTQVSQGSITWQTGLASSGHIYAGIMWEASAEL